MDPQKVTGLNISNDELDQATKRLAFFSPTGSGEYVSELYSFFAEQALSSFKPGRYTGVQIFRRLHELLGMKVAYDELLSGLGNLVKSKRVHCDKVKVDDPGGTFSIEPELHDNASRRIVNQGKFEEQVMEKWRQEVSDLYPELTDREFRDLQVDLREFIYRLVSLSSAESVLLYYSGDAPLSRIVESLDIDEIDKALSHTSQKIRLIRNEMLPAFFRSADEDRKKFIDGLLQSTFILHMIQLDPKCSELINLETRGGNLYLDTNFLFRLFGLHSPELFFATNELLKLSKKLKFSFFITPDTRREYMAALQENLRQLRQAPVLPVDMLKTLVGLSDDDDPIIAYYNKILEKGREAGQNVYIDPSVYYEYFAQIDSFLDNYGIKISDQNCNLIKSDKNRLDTEIRYLKQIAAEIKFDTYYPEYELSEHIANHDAFHRLLILSLRGENDGGNFLDVPYWFLTCDTKLPKYDRVRRKTEHIKTPFCVLAGYWMQTIRPFEPRVSSQALVGSMSSPLLRAYKPVPNHIVREVASRIYMFKGYNETIGKMAMRRQFLLKYYNASVTEREELIQSPLMDFAETKEKEAKAIAEQLELERVEKQQEKKKREDAEKQLKANENKIGELKNNLEKTETEKSNLNDRVVKLEKSVNLLETNLANSDKQSKAVVKSLRSKLYFIFGLTVTFIAAEAVAVPLLKGGLWWLIVSGVLSVFFILSLFIFKPWQKNNLGRLYTFGFPLLIAFSIALPFGKETTMLEVLGNVGDFGGYLGLALYVLFGKE
ncbi:MAG: hypothetical protein HY865_20780 [Chloroflexi bacterium]|nr:hypothetical protein [Chloroflexota bacterium]